MRVQHWINRLTGSRPSRRPAETITLAERDREFRVVLDPNLPDAAYQQLFHLDLSLAPAGVLTWDHQSRGWRFC